MLTTKQRKELWRKRGGNLSALARALRVSRPHVLYVLQGERRSEPIEGAIAQVLGVSVDVAFPPPPKRSRPSRARTQVPDDLPAALAAAAAKPPREPAAA